MSTLTFYADESGTDSNSSVAVVGGLLLRSQDFFWLDVEWRTIQRKYGTSTAIHMREFGKDGALGTIPSDVRKCLLTELVRAINEHKVASVAATLDSDAYRRLFNGITTLSMYGACFAQLVIMNDGEWSRYPYHEKIRYVLDDGNSYKKDILEAKRHLASKSPSLSMVNFCSDDLVAALQAADVVTWSVRRRLAGRFPYGYEPLQGLFDRHHRDLSYEEEWMVGVANLIRSTEASAS